MKSRDKTEESGVIQERKGEERMNRSKKGRWKKRDGGKSEQGKRKRRVKSSGGKTEKGGNKCGGTAGCEE